MLNIQTHPKVPGGALSFKEYTNTGEKQDKKQIIKLGDLIPLALSKRKKDTLLQRFPEEAPPPPLPQQHCSPSLRPQNDGISLQSGLKCKMDRL
jgi:hypothetical protein